MSEQILHALRNRSNFRGLVIARETALLWELRCESAPFRQELAEMEKAGAIEILSPVPFLVLKLAGSWSGKRSVDGEQAAKSADADAPCYSSYSFHNNSIDKSKAIGGENRGVGEGEEGLLQEILATLGETDPTTFRGVLTHHPEPAVRSVLERIRHTPAEKIRKSKTAYFRFLLAKSAK